MVVVDPERMGKITKIKENTPFSNGLDPLFGSADPIMAAQTGERTGINHSIEGVGHVLVSGMRVVKPAVSRVRRGLSH